MRCFDFLFKIEATVSAERAMQVIYGQETG